MITINLLPTKRCRQCERELPLSAFYANRRKCKGCKAADVKAWERANPSKVLAKFKRYRASHLEERRAQDREIKKRLRDSDPLKARAASDKWRLANPDAARAATRKAGAKWRAAHHEEHNLRGREWARANPTKVRAAVLRSKFGATQADIDAQIDKQEGRCAICRDLLLGGRYEHVDHDHDRPGTFRGVLCSECNTGIGKLKENPEILERAAEYIRKDGDLSS